MIQGKSDKPHAFYYSDCNLSLFRDIGLVIAGLLGYKYFQSRHISHIVCIA
jgi:hypothetical protein